MKLIALGDNVIDYYHNTQECFPGGNAVNVAVHAARLGAQAEYLGSLGDDKMAHIVEKALRENGVDISHCPVLQGRTTKVCSYDVVNGERSFIEVITGESWTGPLQIGTQELDELKTADLIVSSCNAKMPEQIAAVQALPAVFAYDFGEKEKYRTDAYYDEVCHGIGSGDAFLQADGQGCFCGIVRAAASSRRGACAGYNGRSRANVVRTRQNCGKDYPNGRGK